MRGLGDKQNPKGNSIKKLKRLWREGVRCGPGRFNSMDEIKAEARRRFETRKQG